MANDKELGAAINALGTMIGSAMTSQVTSEGQKPGETKVIDGKTYQWCGKDQKWEPLG